MAGVVWILPPPDQLPQDYYASQVPPPAVPTAPPVVTPTPPSLPPVTVNNGGIWYGPVPPDNPANGWLWSDTQGRLFLYMDPGVWSQIGATNW